MFFKVCVASGERWVMICFLSIVDGDLISDLFISFYGILQVVESKWSMQCPNGGYLSCVLCVITEII